MRDKGAATEHTRQKIGLNSQKIQSQLDVYRNKGTNRMCKAENRTNYFKHTNKGAKLFKN